MWVCKEQWTGTSNGWCQRMLLWRNKANYYFHHCHRLPSSWSSLQMKKFWTKENGKPCRLNSCDNIKIGPKLEMVVAAVVEVVAMVTISNKVPDYRECKFLHNETKWEIITQWSNFVFFSFSYYKQLLVSKNYLQFSVLSFVNYTLSGLNNFLFTLLFFNSILCWLLHSFFILYKETKHR